MISLQTTYTQPTPLTQYAAKTNRPLQASNKEALRFAGDDGTEIPPSTLQSVLKFRSCKDPSYGSALQNVKNKKLRDEIYKLAKRTHRLKEIAFFYPLGWILTAFSAGMGAPLPAAAKGAQLVTQKQIFGQLKRLPQSIREQWITMMTQDRSLWVQRAGYQAIPLIQDPKLRDWLIANALDRYDSGIRKIGVSMLPLMQNKEAQVEWMKKLDYDRSPFIRYRIGMLKGDHPAVNALLGGFLFNGKLDTPAVEAMQEEPDETIQPVAAKQQEEIEPLQAKLDQLAQDMESRLKEFFSKDALVHQAMLTKYGDEAHLPTAQTLKKQFYTIARKQLQQEQGTLKRLFRAQPAEAKILERAKIFMEIALETGGFLAPETISHQIDLFRAVEKKRKKLELSLNQANQTLAQQSLFRAKSIESHEAQKTRVFELEKAQSEAAKGNNTVEQAKLTELLKEERQALKSAEDRKNVLDTAFGLAQAKVANLTRKIETSSRELIQAIQYGAFDQTSEALNTLNEQDTTLDTDTELSRLLTQAKDHKYTILAQDSTQFAVEEDSAPKAVEKSQERTVNR